MSNVSITFQNTDDARFLVEAIVEDNPGAVVSVMPALTKIDCADRLSIRRETIENKLGRPFDLQELQLSLITLAGNVDEDDESFTLAWKTGAPHRHS
ncbi:MmoB/DmpM family protein [Zavarzinia sp.]|uniref:MmoB/DmpM family protein n=1 Tax=Zavarzinia sp. TaxID=2027920 RepID=UPI0035669BE2